MIKNEQRKPQNVLKMSASQTLNKLNIQQQELL
jgi:hypothetical protein